MEELKMILALHAKRYPMMQPTDAVKLIYQNEFGGGHLIRDEEKCLEYLRKEYASVEKKPGMPLYEEIGNGIVRVYLPALPEGNLEQLGRDFIRSAAAHTGSMERFREKLNILRQVASDGFFVFAAPLTVFSMFPIPALTASSAGSRNIPEARPIASYISAASVAAAVPYLSDTR
jgi:hypothetical protein